MSQAKVERYKQEKKNRKAAVKKQKRKKILGRIIAVLVCAAIAIWIGFSAYAKITAKEASVVKETVVDTSAIDNYVSGLSSDTQ